MRIMVADQDVAHRTTMVSALQKLGHTLQEALSGREVIEICRKKCPDLIFIDSQLADQPGIEIVRQIRQLGGHAVWAPIVLLSKTATDEVIIQGIDAGTDDVLEKPVSEARLRVKLSSAQRLLDLKEEVFKVAHELVVANRALQSVVTQDLLTGLGNSNSFDEALEREWKKARKENKPIAVILLNLDFFQQFNEAYGAKEGDRAIKRVADILKFNSPGGDTVIARMIGESFAVLLPNTSREEALIVAEKMRSAIETLNIPHKSSGCSDHLTASFGVALAEKDHYTDPMDLKDAADFGLYQAKHRGRNRSYLVSADEAKK